jgi:circadian clock protein KaiB
MKQPAVLHVRLYVAGDAPNSSQALSNLKTICQTYAQDRCRVELIDVLQSPERALEDGVWLTPTLVKLSPGPRHCVIGNLSETLLVLSALGLSSPSG